MEAAVAREARCGGADIMSQLEEKISERQSEDEE